MEKKPCIELHFPELAPRRDELVATGKYSPKEASIIAATEEHQRLFKDLQDFKKKIGVATEKYVPFDSKKRADEVKKINDKYNPLIEDKKNGTKSELPLPKKEEPITEGSKYIVRGDVGFTAKDGNTVVDEKGEPITVFHGSDATFNEFKKTKSKRNILMSLSDVESDAHFFTTNKEFAKTFGKNVKEYQISIKNPAQENTDAIIKAIKKTYPDGSFETANGVVYMEDYEGNSWVKKIADKDGIDWFLLDNNKFINNLKKEGIDGTGVWEDDGSISHAVFDKSQIRDIKKTELPLSNEKTDAEQEKTDQVLNPEKKGDTTNEPPNQNSQTAEGGEGEGSILTKAELSKYKVAKDLFERENKTTWNDIVDKAVTKLIKDNPNIPLEKAAENHVNKLADLYDEGNAINPTAQDLAIINLNKLHTEQKIAEIKDWDSNDAADRISAMKDLQPLYEQMQKIAKAANPRESGTAFGIRQMLISMGADGLKVVRMQLMKDKGGVPLSESDLKFTAEQFAKEKDLIEKRNELEKKKLQDDFDAQLKAQDEKYKNLLSQKENLVTTEKKAKTRQEKLQQKGKDLADKLRRGKLGGAMSDPFLLGQAFNKILDGVASIIETGATLTAAIDKYVTDNKIQNKRKAIEDAIINHLDNMDKRENATNKLDEIIADTKSTTITKEMVGAVKDFTDSYVGSHELDKVSDIAYKLLKEKLPDITKEQFKRAYLKQGEFKPETSKDVRNSMAAEKRNYSRLTQLETELGQLTEKGDLVKDTKIGNLIEEKIQAVKDKISKELQRTGQKRNGTSKLQKVADKVVSESHDRNIDNFVDFFTNKVKDLDDGIKGTVAAITESLGGKKIDYKDESSLSQTTKIRKSIENIDVVKKQLESVKKDLPKDLHYDMEMALQNMEDVHNRISEDEGQKVLLAEAKATALTKIKDYERKLVNKEFDDTPQTSRSLTQNDYELVKVNADLNLVKSAFEKKKEEYQNANRSVLDVLLNTGKSIAVNTLIGMPKTFFKLAVASPAKILTTYLSKATVGQLNSIVFDKGLIQAAKEGGESSSFQSMNAGLDAVFKNSNQKQLEAQADKNAASYTDIANKFQKSNEKIASLDVKSSEYAAAKAENNSLKAQTDKALRKSVSDIMYQFIGGKTLDTFIQKLQNRNTVYEQSLGEFRGEEYKKVEGWKDVADNISYVMSYVGRSHGALKSISARFHYATSFMAKLEGAMERGEDITSLQFAEKTSAECFTDWESGMFQQDNWITDKTNKWVNELKDSDNGFARAIGHGLNWDVAITKVPVNMMNEAIMEIAFGLPISIAKTMKVNYTAKNIVRAAMPEIKTKAEKAEFKARLSEELSHLDKAQAAQILRAFRHGGFGLGILALGATVGASKFGGWSHMGQTNEDKKKGEKDPKTTEIIVGDTKLNEYIAGSLEHTNAMYPLLVYKAMVNTFTFDKSMGKTDAKSAGDMIYTELEHVIGSYPQTKIINPLSIAKEIYKTYPNAAKKMVNTYSGGAINLKVTEKENKPFNIKNPLEGTERLSTESETKKFVALRDSLTVEKIKGLKSDKEVMLNIYGHPTINYKASSGNTKPYNELNPTERLKLISDYKTQATKEAKDQLFGVGADGTLPEEENNSETK